MLFFCVNTCWLPGWKQEKKTFKTRQRSSEPEECPAHNTGNPVLTTDTHTKATLQYSNLKKKKLPKGLTELLTWTRASQNPFAELCPPTSSLQSTIHPRYHCLWTKPADLKLLKVCVYVRARECVWIYTFARESNQNYSSSPRIALPASLSSPFHSISFHFIPSPPATLTCFFSFFHLAVINLLLRPSISLT